MKCNFKNQRVVLLQNARFWLLATFFGVNFANCGKDAKACLDEVRQLFAQPALRTKGANWQWQVNNSLRVIKIFNFYADCITYLAPQIQLSTATPSYTSITSRQKKKGFFFRTNTFTMKLSIYTVFILDKPLPPCWSVWISLITLGIRCPLVTKVMESFIIIHFSD